MNISLRVALTLLPVAGSHIANAAQPGPARPNIVLILADDLGVGDLTCYHGRSQVPTPQMDRLAREGIRFDTAYAPDAICTPSRYALFTGRYSWRSHLHRGGHLNWEHPLIEESRITLPKLLQLAGYRTAGLGKWHLGATFPTVDGLPPLGQETQRHPQEGANLDLTKPLQDGPLDRGFDHWFGFICASEGLVYEGRFPVACVEIYPRPKAGGADALRNIPLAEYLPELTRKAIDYISAQAAGVKSGAPFFLNFAPYVPHIPLAVEARFRGVTKGGDYGDYVAALDHYVGNLLDALERNGLAEDTLVILTSDNGSWFEETGEGHRPNGILRGKKSLVFEGGTRVPLILRWPKRIAAGRVSGNLVASADLLATFSALTGVPLPENAGEDSFNLLPVLLGEDGARSPREFVITKAAAQLALREGRWKFIAPPDYPWSFPSSKWLQNAALYDLSVDPSESTNLIAEHLARAAAMRTKLLRAVDGTRTAPQRAR